ncbi:hypothetical protein FRC01_012972 [Tulasnella sp. 417]|nr:hypothetical protein FRC01_012972 [Tulasnella sp. 417]
MSHQPSSSQNSSQWTKRPDGVDYTVSSSELRQFAKDYPPAQFSSAQEDVPSVETNAEVIGDSYFRAYCPGLNLNIPIPLHPELDTSGFYCQLSYILGACKAFRHGKDLEELQEPDLNSDHLARGAMVPKIRQALAKGQPVLVRQCSTRFDGVPIQIESETFCRLTLSKESPVEAQDMLGFPRIVHTTFGGFWDHMFNPREILNLLDMNCHLREGRPGYMAGIFDDGASTRTVSSMIPVEVGDLVRYHQWMLFGHPFAHTYAHNDTAGLATYVTVVEGRKLWFILKWTVEVITPEMWHYRWKHLGQHETLVLEYSRRPPWVVGRGREMRIDQAKLEKCHGEWETFRVAEWVCADLEPGTTLIMPPCTVHWVFKPKMSLATGGQGIITDCLPLTEIGCRMDSLSSDTTNDIHASMPLVHDAIALGLPENPSDAISQGWSRTQLASLVRMVLQPNLYRQEVVRSDADKRYNKIPGGKLEKNAKKRMEDYRKALNVSLPTTGTWYNNLEDVPVDVFEWATFRL